MNDVAALYADGGVIGKNPSAIGGTWAWAHVDVNGERIKTASGIITPTEAQMPAITNNLTELYAIVLGLEAVSAAWAGTVYSDSWVSLQRVFLAAKLLHVPDWLIARLQTLQKSGQLRAVRWQLLDGHPTRAQLAAGKGKRGNLVSVHNVFCDAECQRQAKEATNANAR